MSKSAEPEKMKEAFPSPPNLPPKEFGFGRFHANLRPAVDLQVASLLIHLSPWLTKLSGSVLEVGCGAQPYRRLIPEICQYQGLDWVGSEEHFGYRAPDVIYHDGRSFPFEDNTFDRLFHTEVLEHVYDSEFFLTECHRVLKPGGEMFCSVPFQARYHYIPYDYWRFTPAALERMATSSGFRSTNIMPRGNDLVVAAYKNLSLVYRWLQGGWGSKVLGVIFSPLAVCALIAGQIWLRLRIGSPDDCLGYVMIAKK